MSTENESHHNRTSPYCGMSFHSFEEFEMYLKEFMKDSKSYFVKRDSKLNENTIFKFSWIHYQCKHGPRNIISQSTGKRNATSVKLNCPAEIKLSFKKSENVLKVTKVVLKHNHEKFYDSIPEVRRLEKHHEKQVLELLKLGCKKTEIVNKLFTDAQKKIKTKDLHNLTQKFKHPNQHRLDEAIKALHANDADVFVAKENDKFKGLYFSTFAMRNAVKNWPEINFVDGTYNLLVNGMVVVLAFVEDSNGATHIACVGLFVEENIKMYCWFFQQMKNEHPHLETNVSCWMSDKCKMIRSSIHTEFPKKPIYICAFHVQQSFQREITVKKMNITSDQVKRALKILHCMVYSNSSKEYDVLFNTLTEEMPEKVVQYFTKNWHCCRTDWTKFNMRQSNFRNMTNNRSEAMNARLKAVVGKNSSLLDFITKLFNFFASRVIAQDHIVAENFTKRSSRKMSTVEKSFREFLTSYAAEKVMSELDMQHKLMSKNINKNIQQCQFVYKKQVVTATNINCDCLERQNWSLPCRHIFAVRRIFRLNFFCPEVCANRWTNAFLKLAVEKQNEIAVKKNY